MKKISRIAVILFLAGIFFAACTTVAPVIEIPEKIVQDVEKVEEIEEIEEIEEVEEVQEITEEPEPEPEAAIIMPVRFAYLTFDDGPSRNTNRILNILAGHGVKATFFFVGDRILEQQNPSELLKRVLAQGHYIGLHSMTHDFNELYAVPNAHQNFYDQMREVQKIIYEKTGGYKTNLYRPPYGSSGTFHRTHVRKMAASDLKCWDWNIDTLDWQLRSTDAIMERIKKEMERHNTPDNAVILMHENDRTVQALPAVIEYYLSLGYIFLPYHPDKHFVMNLLGNPNL